MSEGTARIVKKALVEMVTDGPCLAGTLEQLEGGVAARPMPGTGAARGGAHAPGLLGNVLQSYSERSAPGDLGTGDTAQASDAAPTDSQPPTGLLNVRVQSCKTDAMITFCAAS